MSADWLWDCVKDGVKKPIQPYLIRAPTVSGEAGRSQKSTTRLLSDTEKRHDTDRPESHALHIDNEPAQSRKQDRIRNPRSLSNNRDDSELCASLADLPPIKDRASSIVKDRECGLEPAPGSEESHKTTPTEVAPLQEVSPNSPTKPSSTLSQLQPIPPIRPNPPDPEDRKQQDFLATSISALLSHARQLNATTSNLENQYRPQHAPSVAPPGRRRRALFGRAPSNVSACSNSNSISISRASSVDTLNTDGLGTPIEPTATTSFVLDSVGIKSLHDEEQEDEENTPRGTQIGYHDPEVGEWRERMVRKMAGKGDVKAVGATKGKALSSDIGTAKDVDRGWGNPGSGRVSGRATRQRGLRRVGL